MPRCHYCGRFLAKMSLADMIEVELEFRARFEDFKEEDRIRLCGLCYKKTLGGDTTTGV